MAASSSSAPLWDPSLFLKTLHVVGIKVTQEKTSGYLKHFSSSLLKRKNLKPIQKASQTMRLLLLDPEKLPTVASVQTMDGIGKMLEEDKAEVFMQDIQLQYDSFTLDEALRMVLPQDIQEIPSSFEIIGHIAHLNLRTPCLPHKHIIGRMIIDVRDYHYI
jgi:tRNA (guanine37-N1)-methyltransferase